jgi:hypothetical protein
MGKKTLNPDAEASPIPKKSDNIVSVFIAVYFDKSNKKIKPRFN